MPPAPCPQCGTDKTNRRVRPNQRVTDIRRHNFLDSPAGAFLYMPTCVASPCMRACATRQASPQGRNAAFQQPSNSAARHGSSPDVPMRRSLALLAGICPLGSLQGVAGGGTSSPVGPASEPPDARPQIIYTAMAWSLLQGLSSPRGRRRLASEHPIRASPPR